MQICGRPRHFAGPRGPVCSWSCRVPQADGLQKQLVYCPPRSLQSRQLRPGWPFPSLTNLQAHLGEVFKTQFVLGPRSSCAS